MIENDLFIIILGFRRLSLGLALEQRLERLRLEDPLAGGLRGKGWLWRPEDEIVVENDARLLATSLSFFGIRDNFHQQLPLELCCQWRMETNRPACSSCASSFDFCCSSPCRPRGFSFVTVASGSAKRLVVDLEHFQSLLLHPASSHASHFSS